MSTIVQEVLCFSRWCWCQRPLGVYGAAWSWLSVLVFCFCFLYL